MSEPIKCQFFVPGTPLTKGSMRSFLNPKTNSIVTMAKNDKLKCWESDVRFFAAEAWDTVPTSGPVRCCLTFDFLRPKNHYRTGRLSTILREKAPQRMAQHKRYDLDKLIRAVFDGMTGVVYVDDAQVYEILAHKRFGLKPGVKVEVACDD